MVSLGMFVLTKLGLQVFAASDDARFLMRTLFAGLGCATAVVGALMAWRQRHLKRLLAFSTISHLGIMLTGVASLTAAGAAGVVVYFVGHGLVKGALFMVVGMLLATRASLDELDLKGLGRGLWPVAAAMGLGGLLLAGLPWGVLDHGTRLAEAGGGPLAEAAILIGAGVTGAAVLRATGRIFFDLGPDPGDEADAPSQADQEKADRPLWLMMLPCGLLLALALAPARLAEDQIARAVTMLAGPQHAATGPATASESPLPWVSTAFAIALAALNLLRERLPRRLRAAAGAVTRPLFEPIKRVHDGLVGDYVLWIALGLAAFSAAFAFRGS
jgi:multicomponent Na+:H+ antiporter subunit D